jgi:hypothetical protein
MPLSKEPRVTAASSSLGSGSALVAAPQPASKLAIKAMEMMTTTE